MTDAEVALRLRESLKTLIKEGASDAELGKVFREGCREGSELSNALAEDAAVSANKYRLKVAEKMLDLFKEAHGRPCQDPKELEDWAVTAEGKAAFARHRGPDGKIIP
jgi:hypothetical protein